MLLSIQGNRGSFHHIVAQNIFGSDIELIERDTFREVFDDTKNGSCDYGIVAIENSIAGSIHENYDHLVRYDLFIQREYYLRIEQQLIAHQNVTTENIRQVFSHPMAIKQCRDFLELYPEWQIVEAADTAGSVAKIKNEGRLDAAAIASDLAATIHDMNIVAHSIQTEKQNYTRFFVLGKDHTFLPISDKTSLVFTTKNEAGALVKILNLLGTANINMSKLESRPVASKTWEYYFYLDVEKNLLDPNCAELLAQIQDYTTWFKVLGVYPREQGVV